MLVKSLIVATTFILGLNIGYSQNAYRNSVSLELGGHAYFYSVNYERQFNNGLVARGGISFVYKSFLFPVTIGKIFGKKTHHFELAGGLEYFNYRQTNNGVVTRRNALMATSFIGYRYQKPDKRFFIRGGLTPVYLLYNSDPINDPSINQSPLFIWGGISAGFRF